MLSDHSHAVVGNHYITMYKSVFLAHRHVLVFRPRVFSRTLGSVARWEHAGTPRLKCGPGRRTWHALWGFKVARPHGEAFRSRGAVQPPANPHTGLNECPTAHVISGILNVINVVRHSLVMEKAFPNTNS